VPAPDGREDADGLAVEAAERVAKRARGGGVEPLEVVDRQQGRPGLAELPELGEHGPAVGELRLLSVEAGLVDRVAVEEVEEPAERKRRLLLCRPRHEDVLAAPASLGERSPPQGRLADPGLAADEQRLCPLWKGAQERVDASLLGFASHNVGPGPREGADLAHGADYRRGAPVSPERAGGGRRVRRGH
jgi:hypothetical protein